MSMLKASALTWMLGVFLVGVVLVALSMLIDIPFKWSNNLKFGDLKCFASAQVGVVAMLGFTGFYILLHILGRRIGDPYSVKSWKMTTVVLIINLDAALTGGGVWGWILLKAQDGIDATGYEQVKSS